MTRKGNLRGLRKAIRANPRMSRATKMRALSTVERKLWRAKPSSFRQRSHSYRRQGVEGLREAGVAAVKLASHPIDQVIEGYHIVNGLRKFANWLDRLLS